MELFKHVLLRRGGKPYEDFEALCLEQSETQMSKIFEQEKKLETCAEELCDELFQRINKETDSKTQNKLLNLKRDIFNLKSLSPQKIDFLNSMLAESGLIKIENYLALKSDIEEKLKEGEAFFNEEIALLRKVLSDISSDPNFHKGLLLSSQSLLERVETYIKKKGKGINKKDKKTEQSLMKYLSRMACKTSPFSTFTNLSMAECKSHPETFIKLKKEHPEMVSHIRLNNNLFKYLLSLFNHLDDFFSNFHLRPNPSLSRTENDFHFLTNANNIESFQTLGYSEVLELFISLSSEKEEGIPFGSLVEKLIAFPELDAEEDDIKKYIRQLISYGFLEINTGISGIDPDWDLKLVEKLGRFPECDATSHTVDTLKKIRNCAEKYALSGTADRKQILIEAFDSFQSLCMMLHEKAGLPDVERMTAEERKTHYKKLQEDKKENKDTDKTDETKTPDTENASKLDESSKKVFTHQSSTFFNFKPEQMFYEDTTVDHKLSINKNSLEKIVEKIESLINPLFMFESRMPEQIKMKHFFDTFYNGKKSVPLLQFYEDYTREVKLPEEKRIDENKKKAREEQANKKDNTEKKEPAEKDTESQKESDRWHPPFFNGLNTLKHMFLKQLSENFEVKNSRLHLTADMLNTCLESVDLQGLPERYEKTSFGSFIHFYENTDSDDNTYPCAMLNSVFMGHGKMLSRFMHLFENKITEDMRTYNKSIKPDSILAENTDASIFNANLHPPMMPYEIWAPGSQNALPAEKQIAVTDLIIQSGKHRLELIHKQTGARVYIYDLCFQALQSRSKLFQLLEKFTSAEGITHFSILREINNAVIKTRDASQKDGVIIYPRIIFEEDIVLQRKKWIIPTELLPLKESTDTDFTYALKLNRWRKQLDIPEEIFVSIVNRSSLEYLPADKRKGIGRDDYKQQYISFKNPFLITLFEKLAQKVPVAMEIEEMLPASSDLMKSGDKRYVTEWVLQWTHSEDKKEINHD